VKDPPKTPKKKKEAVGRKKLLKIHPGLLGRNY